MERMWSREVSMKYPKQWVVLVNLSWEINNKVMGDIFFITSNEDEAYAKAREIGASLGRNMVVEGFDDTPQIGGLELWRQ